MSGFVGIFHRDRNVADCVSIQRLTEALRYRGARSAYCWTAGATGLGQTLPDGDETPTVVADKSRDCGSLQIVGDVRLDAVEELRSKLADQGLLVNPQSGHLDMVRLAWGAWGAGCLSYLCGDFAFGIWDNETGTLFCARDQFGVKPFYFHVSQELLLFSNTLSCLRRHPAISDELNESAVGDFLLFGLNYDKRSTTFRDIQRLPPGHCLQVSKSEFCIERYWELPTEDRLRYPSSDQYVEHFLELLTSAVTDRLPGANLGILLSGGLDSGAVAASATAIRRGNGKSLPRSYTCGYGPAEEEGPWAKKTAEHLGISNSYVSLDTDLFDEAADPSKRFPEPVDDPLAASLFLQFEAIGEDCQVIFSGEGADNLMYFQMWPYVKELRRNGQWWRLFSEAMWFATVRPVPWLGARRRVEAFFRRAADLRLPPWIEPEFGRRTNLLERYREATRGEDSPKRHLARPAAYASMGLPEWGRMFELNDAGVTRTDVEVRYPFLDLRMVRYLLAIPPFPWSYRKSLIRIAMEKFLPSEILQRAKTPLRRDPVLARLDGDGVAKTRSLQLGTRTWEFISREKVATFCDTMSVEDLRPYCLGVWLRGLGQG